MHKDWSGVSIKRRHEDVHAAHEKDGDALNMYFIYCMLCCDSHAGPAGLIDRLARQRGLRSTEFTRCLSWAQAILSDLIGLGVNQGLAKLVKADADLLPRERQKLYESTEDWR